MRLLLLIALRLWLLRLLVPLLLSSAAVVDRLSQLQQEGGVATAVYANDEYQHDIVWVLALRPPAEALVSGDCSTTDAALSRESQILTHTQPAATAAAGLT